MDMAQAASDAFVFSMRLVGGALCFDFTNTLDGRGGASANSIEYLHDYSDLVAWGQHTQVLTAHEATVLYTEAMRQPDAAVRVFQCAITLREALYRLFAAVAHDTTPTTADLATLNGALKDAMQHASIHKTSQGFAWDWQEVAPTALACILWPVTRSAAQVLTDERRQRVRECPGKDCSWLFVDTSKNHSRRWCDMDSCGNRAKARRHYRRKRNSDALDR